MPWIVIYPVDITIQFLNNHVVEVKTQISSCLREMFKKELAVID